MDFEESGGSCSDEQGDREGLNGGEESTRALIIQVKEELERCLETGMSKEQMFGELREKGLHPAVVFAVYKELRDQNQGLFREYYDKIDQRKQVERAKRLLHQYRTVRDAAAATATPPAAIAIPDVDVGLPEHWIVPVGLDSACGVSSSSGDCRFAGSEQLPSSTTMHVLAGQLLHHRELQPVPSGGVQGVVPSAACTSNDAMAVPYPWSCTDNVGMSWHGEQAEPLQQWWPSAGTVPPWGSYWQPPSYVEILLENHNHREHGEQAEHLDFEEHAGTCSSEQGSREGLNGGGEESTRAFIVQVKELERCLEAGMSKEEMFRVFREKGLHPAVVFASNPYVSILFSFEHNLPIIKQLVYKELHDQNQDLFREYYDKIDLRKQTERAKRLLHQYRKVRDAAAATVTPPTAMAIPDVSVGLPEHWIGPVGLDGACGVSSSSGDRQVAGSAQLPSSTTMHVLAGQLLCQRAPPVTSSWVQGVVPSAASTSNDAMAVSYPRSRTDNVGMSGRAGKLNLCSKGGLVDNHSHQLKACRSTGIVTIMLLRNHVLVNVQPSDRFTSMHVCA